jgi:soluble lytic murein transglycosylase
VSKTRVGVLVFFLILNSCAALQSCAAQRYEADFYEGLKKRQNGAPNEAAIHFEKALNSPNVSIVSAATAELMSLHSAGTELSEATMADIRQKADGFWAKVFAAQDQDGMDREKFLNLLLDGESRLWGTAEYYTLEEWRGRDNILLTDAENAAIDGRIAAGRSRYNEALLFFRITLSDSPGLFFQHPDLLIDLGRTFQYTATGREGIDLFLDWEENGAIPADNENLIRFRLLFFAARIARQRGDHKNIEMFEKALPFAREVSPEQTDACIWYILDSSLAQDSGRTIRYLETYIPQWHDEAYFSDVLGKLSRELVNRRQWENMAKVFTLLRNRPGAITAQYAWIVGRVIEENLFSPEESAQSYMRAAYDAAGSVAVVDAWYYRSLSAAALKESFLVLSESPLSSAHAPEKPPKKALSKKTQEKTAVPSDLVRFLLGFFENDAAQFASQYIKAKEKNLSPEELYLVAKALGTAGQYQESIRLVALYARRNDYKITRQDLELLYPRPFRELVEQYAQETDIEPSLLYGLIRTESAFNPDVVSRAGATGLTQLMPATAKEMAGRIRRRGGPDYTSTPATAEAATSEASTAAEDSAINLRNPAINIHIGATYLAYLNERMEDPILALLAYNGGMNRIRRWRRTANLPPDIFLESVEYSETRNYGRSVMGAAAMYKELYYKAE